MRRLEFHISYLCSQSCLFCSESGRMERFRRSPVSAVEIARVLAAKRREGFDHVTFTGGEPTLHPRFLWALEAAKRLGFSTYVTSNGARLCERAFAREALPLIDELCLSVHADAPGLHDALTREPGGFRKLMGALENAAASRVFLLTNTVVTRGNWGRIEQALDFILDLPGVRHCLLSQVAPEGRAQQSYADLAVPLAWWKRAVPGLARLAEERKTALRFFGLPLCVLGAYRENSNDLYFSARATVERAAGAGAAGLSEVISVRPTRNRVQPPLCAGCALRGDCAGVFERHVEEFGAEGLEPIGNGK